MENIFATNRSHNNETIIHMERNLGPNLDIKKIYKHLL